MLNNSDTDKNLNTLLEEIKQELLSYIGRRFRLLKLDTYEKLSITISSLGYGLIILAIVAVLLFFILMGMAFFIGELFDSMGAGFGIMALFSLLVLLLVYLCRKSIKRTLLEKSIILFRKIEANDEN